MRQHKKEIGWCSTQNPDWCFALPDQRGLCFVMTRGCRSEAITFLRHEATLKKGIGRCSMPNIGWCFVVLGGRGLCFALTHGFRR